MGETTGILIFTLWYIAIAFNYLICPIFQRRDRDKGFKCNCERGTCPLMSASNSRSNTSEKGDISTKVEEEEDEEKPPIVELPDVDLPVRTCDVESEVIDCPGVKFPDVDLPDADLPDKEKPNLIDEDVEMLK